MNVKTDCCNNLPDGSDVVAVGMRFGLGWNTTPTTETVAQNSTISKYGSKGQHDKKRK